jgi:exosome complex component RRP40
MAAGVLLLKRQSLKHTTKTSDVSDCLLLSTPAALAIRPPLQNFVVDIGAPFPAQLPMLSFEGATRRNRPNLVTGDLVYARVITANRDMDPVLSCIDAQGKSSGFGALKGGFVLECGLNHARALLARPPAPVLSALGAKLQFELAVGMNGRVWLDSSSCATTVKVANVLQQAQGVAAADVQQWVAGQLQQ